MGQVDMSFCCGRVFVHTFIAVESLGAIIVGVLHFVWLLITGK